MTQFLTSADELARMVPDGRKVAVFKDSGVPMELARALLRRRARGLHLVTVPTSGLFADLLIGAGCVATIETAGVSLGEYGPAHGFVRAVRSGSVRILDSTCPAIYAGLQAAEKGNPFMPLRGLIGSDLLAARTDYAVISNPFAIDDPIVAVPAIRPDIALMHVPLADRAGNVWIGRAGELKTMAHAAACTFVTAEAIQDANLLDDSRLAAAAIPAHYISAIAPAAKGAWPLDMPGRYGADTEHLAAYARRTREPEGFAAYLNDLVEAAGEAAE
jgi:glutaconate CoA-transferase, subunit A